MSDNSMTKAERDELLRLVRAKARLAKAGIEQHQAALLADFEAKLAAVYKPADDPVWQQLNDAAEVVVRDANAKVAERCRDLGIPEEFMPGIACYWHGRGVNGSTQRRAELRRVAQTRLEAEAKRAKVAIDTWAVEAHTELVAGALESGEARRFFDAMPTLQTLMPALEVGDLEAEARPPRYLPGAPYYPDALEEGG